MNIFRRSSSEYKLYILLKEFSLLAFSSNVTSSDAPRLDSLASQIVPKFTKLASRLVNIQKKKKKEHKKSTAVQIVKGGGSVYCKLHQLLHYGDLLLIYGPLIHYASHRYERKHAYSKGVARAMRCFINPAKSVHEKLATNRALYEERDNFIDKDFWYSPQHELENGQLAPTESFLPNATTDEQVKSLYHKLTTRDFPFRTGKNLLRKILDKDQVGQSPRWFKVKKFYQSTSSGEIFCYGAVYQIQSTNHSTTHLRKLSKTQGKCYIPVKHLHYSNDYFFSFHLPDSNTIHTYYIEWIY